MITFKNGVSVGSLWLAPMAGVGDRAARLTAKSFGADYTVTEMTSAKAVRYRDEKTFALASLTEGELPAAVQLFGSEPDDFAFAADVLLSEFSKRGLPCPTAFDVNMGCPVKKVVSCGEGSALMLDTPRAAGIVAALVKATPLPVTAKIRTGYDGSRKNAAEFAKALEQAGVSAICVHGRTRAQFYSPGVDLDAIAEVKRSVSVPVIGNGDISTPEDAAKMLSVTGCDGIAIGRGAIGSPWLFSQIKNGAVPPDGNERMRTFFRQVKTAAEEKGERRALCECRTVFMYYTKGMRGASALRSGINEITSLDGLYRFFSERFDIA
ncbi:MAG: tRNA-dihydrouridine synthase family protein [Clostridia bacterium]|nr:tRNA-dihydrouridine synthase family protein [Clostridia bacterium]